MPLVQFLRRREKWNNNIYSVPLQLPSSYDQTPFIPPLRDLEEYYEKFTEDRVGGEGKED